MSGLAIKGFNNLGNLEWRCARRLLGLKNRETQFIEMISCLRLKSQFDQISLC